MEEFPCIIQMEEINLNNFAFPQSIIRAGRQQRTHML